MPRLRPIEDSEATETQRLLIETARANGAPDPLCAQIYVRSEAGRNWLRHWNELLNGGILPVPLREAVRVLISMKHQCGYCSTVRSTVARARGLTEEKLLATMEFETSDLFDEREKAALRFATLFKAGDDAIDSDEVYADLKRHFSEEEIIELALLCAETDGVGKFARSLKMRTWEEACELQPKLRARREGRGEIAGLFPADVLLRAAGGTIRETRRVFGASKTESVAQRNQRRNSTRQADDPLPLL